MTNQTKPKADKKQQWEMPFPDFTKMMQAYKIPGVDVAAFMDREKRNIEALTEANKIAFEGWQALVRRQSEILQQTMQEAAASARKQESPAQRMEVAKQGFEKAIGHMRELAEMATKSQTEAFEIVRKRFSANVHEMQRFGKHE